MHSIVCVRYSTKQNVDVNSSPYMINMSFNIPIFWKILYNIHVSEIDTLSAVPLKGRQTNFFFLSPIVSL